MGRYERNAKTSLKEASSLASGLIESIRIDLRREEVRLEEEMRDRVNAVQSVLSDVASIQDAIIAGSIETRRELNKAKKRLVKSGDREQMKVQILSTAGRLGELRTLHKDAVSRLQGALARPPSAVDIIERMTRDLLKMSGSWEADAREIDEAMGEVVDANPPLELVELSREIENGGFDLILAGSDRDEHSIAESREKINSLSNADSESSQ